MSGGHEKLLHPLMIHGALCAPNAFSLSPLFLQTGQGLIMQCMSWVHVAIDMYVAKTLLEAQNENQHICHTVNATWRTQAHNLSPSFVGGRSCSTVSSVVQWSHGGPGCPSGKLPTMPLREAIYLLYTLWATFQSTRSTVSSLTPTTIQSHACEAMCTMNMNELTASQKGISICQAPCITPCLSD